MPETSPDTTTGNPFSLIAFMLFKARHALEDLETGRPPRWVRIARGREFKNEPLGALVRTTVAGLASATSSMVELALDLEELLVQTDAAKAIAETSLDLFAAATSPEFTNGIAALLGNDPDANVVAVLEQINAAAHDVEGYLDYIPEPYDLRQLGHELYRLLCIVQQPFPRAADGTIDVSDDDLTGEAHLDLEQTGKIRLCAWAYGQFVRVRGLGSNESLGHDVARLGVRRLFAAGLGGLPDHAHMSWTFEDQSFDLFDFDFELDADAVDLAELVVLLKAHGYLGPQSPSNPTSFTPQIVQALLQFQHLNGLPTSGELDNRTLNRLLNLDFERKNLRRAVRYKDASWPWGNGTPERFGGELEVVNGSADDYEAEGIPLVSGTPYPYYVVRVREAAPPGWTGRGWLADPTPPGQAFTGFVALASRSRSPDGQVGRYPGGLWSEGEASDRFFWAARHTEPWKDGRTGEPGPGGPYGTSMPANGEITRMYQWIPLPTWLQPPAIDAMLHVYASGLQRSLWSDRDATGLPDQGRIVLEAYSAAHYSDTLGPRGTVVASAATELFPSHGTTVVMLQLPVVDRRRVWTLRTTPALELDRSGVVALCLVVEGVHRSAYDTDAYFDDLRIHYEWRLPGSGT